MDIIIDPKIRDWVLLPIILVMFFVGVFRFYLNQYMNYTKTVDKPSKSAVKDHVNKNIVAMAVHTIQNNNLLTDTAFKMRKAHFCKKPNGVLYRNNASANPTGMPNMGMNPSAMTDMLKNNLSMAVSTMLQFAWISFFFSGFVLAKVPFSLTQKFKSMLQKGVEIQNLDVKYVSSLSLYFLILFGLNGLQNLILTSKEADEEFSTSAEHESMKNPMAAMGGMGGMGAPPAGGAPGQPPDYNKLFTTERENMELIKHEFLPATYENLAIEKLRKELAE